VHLIRPYLENAKGAIIVCDVSNPASIEAAATWHQELAEHFSEGNSAACSIPVVVFLNKVDLLQQDNNNSTSSLLRLTTGAKLQELCHARGINGWFAGSAKTGENVQPMFDFITRCMIVKASAKKSEEDSKAEVEDEAVISLQQPTFKRDSQLVQCCYTM
jgi:GTPase SAR1 family protein